MNKRFFSSKLQQQSGLILSLSILVILIVSPNYGNSNFEVTRNLELSNQVDSLNLIYIDDDDDQTKTKCVCSVKCPGDRECKCCASTESPTGSVFNKVEFDKCTVPSNNSNSDKSKFEVDNNSTKDDVKDFSHYHK